MTKVKNLFREKLWFKILLLLLTIFLFVGMFGMIKYINRTKDFLTSSPWVAVFKDDEGNSSSIDYIFSDKQYSIGSTTVDVKYGRIKPTISYTYDGSHYTFNIKRNGEEAILENTHNKDTLTLIKKSKWQQEQKKEQDKINRENKKIDKKNFEALKKNAILMVNNFNSMLYYSGSDPSSYFIEFNSTRKNTALNINRSIINNLEDSNNIRNNYLQFSNALEFSVSLYENWFNTDFQDKNLENSFLSSKKELEEKYDKLTKENFSGKDVFKYYEPKKDGKTDKDILSKK